MNWYTWYVTAMSWAVRHDLVVGLIGCAGFMLAVDALLAGWWLGFALSLLIFLGGIMVNSTYGYFRKEPDMRVHAPITELIPGFFQLLMPNYYLMAIAISVIGTTRDTLTVWQALLACVGLLATLGAIHVVIFLIPITWARHFDRQMQTRQYEPIKL